MHFLVKMMKKMLVIRLAVVSTESVARISLERKASAYSQLTVSH